MKHIVASNQPAKGSFPGLVQSARRRAAWPILTVAGLLLTGTGIVLAQDATVAPRASTQVSTLPAPPAMPAPPAGAPVPGGPMGPDAGPGPRDGGPDARGGALGLRDSGPGPRGESAGPGPRDGGPGVRDGGPRGAAPDPRDGGKRAKGKEAERGRKGGPADGPGRDMMDGPRGGPRRGPVGKPGDGPMGGPDGAHPTPPDANTQEGAGHALERAYRSIGDTQTVDGDAKTMADNARTLYGRAYEAYNAKNYSRAAALADASERLSRTTRELADANSDGPQLQNVPGLTPPPVVAPKNTDDAGRAARELNHNYDEANRATKFDNADSNRYRTLSEANYRLALNAYNAKDYKGAIQMARLGATQAKAAREYAETLALAKN